MRNIIRAAALFCVAALAVTALVSCGRHDEDEIKKAAAELIEKSYEINEIFFGEGLPLAEEEEYASTFPGYAVPAPSVDPDSGDDMTYYMVSPKTGYSSVDDIKKGTLAVYTEEYAEPLFDMAFSGFAVTVGGDRTERTDAVSYARYIDTTAGYLGMRKLADHEILPLGRTYDTSAMTVVKNRGNEASVSVRSFADGKDAGEIEIALKLTGDGWRLDSPTY